jgi:tetratricopeptide (TPR) repeat protein
LNPKDDHNLRQGFQTRVLELLDSQQLQLATQVIERWLSESTDPVSELDSLCGLLIGSHREQDCLQLAACFPKQFDENTSLIRLLAVAHLRLQQPEPAKELANRIIESQPDFVDAYVLLADLAWQSDDVEGVLEAFQRLCAALPDDVGILRKCGSYLVRMNAHAQALAFFENALALDPEDAQSHNDLARTHQQTGQFDAAAKHYRKAIQAERPIAGAILGLAHSQRYERDSCEADQSMLTSMLAADSSLEYQTAARFALGKLNDDIGDYAEAWRHYSQGNKLCRSLWPRFDPAAFDQRINGLVETDFSTASRERPSTEMPMVVFVVGMPRSGSTLLERELLQFPGTMSGGETEFIGTMIEALAQQANTPIEDFSSVAHQVPGDLYGSMARQFLDAIAPQWHGLQLVVDKNPLNFLYIDYIMRIFPWAKILHTTRSPIDVCLSNYFQFFAHPMMNFSFDWVDLLHFYRGYQRLMDSHAERYGDEIQQINYEEFVAEPEQQKAQLATFLGLAGNPEHQQQENKAIRTASIWQARQDVYQTSVGRWQNYQPLMSEALRQELARLAQESVI